jgi:hypothetical protein
MVAQPLYGLYRQRLIIFSNLYHLALCLSVVQFVSKCASLFRAMAPILWIANLNISALTGGPSGRSDRDRSQAQKVERLTID